LEEIGKGLSPFPYLLAYAQEEHERLLISKLAAHGVEVERPTEVVALSTADNHVLARLRHANGTTDECEATYVVGCDGARSFVREALRVQYPGGTYSHLFYVADVEASGPTMNGEAHFALEDDGNFLACIALRKNQARLIGTVRDDAAKQEHELGWDDISKRVLERLSLEVARVNWFSTYRVHHRVALDFRVGRVFLAGDAAHIHSPVGGQGMNTGIGDAVNLAWKLAAVVHGHASAYILDSYERERLPFAKRLVRTTDRVFELMSADGLIARKVRVGVAPQLLMSLFQSERARRLLFRTVSQINIRYRNSWLSEGRAGRIEGGDRLPWVASQDSADNFEPLSSLGWQVHVYGLADDYLAKACVARHLPLHAFPWSADAERAGLEKDAIYLIRPDGYVALAASGPEPAEQLGRYLAARNLRFGDGGGV
jgi:2-polyprenyl-6-methoxyphenol hydroxylase-like FAD-dependent oxidoreductase